MKRVETDIEKYGGSTESKFTGTMLELLAINLGTWFLSWLTLGIATPWLVCWATKWKTENTIINGKKMRFDGEGSGLFFEYIKWWLLGVITLGIYGLWIPVKLEQWMVKRIHFEGARDRESCFNGGMLEYWGVEIATIVLTVLTLGIAYPWLLSWQTSWYKRHTCISEEQLHFDGRGAQLFVKWIQWGILTILTLGIYGLWVPVKVQQWIVKHTYMGHFAPMPDDEPGPIERFVRWVAGKKPEVNTWKCSCGHDNPNGTSYCCRCGEPKNKKEHVCPKCRSLLTECTCRRSSLKKCDKCGKVYSGDKCNCELVNTFSCAKCGRQPVYVRGGICPECSWQSNPKCRRCGRRPVTRVGEICDICERFNKPGTGDL